MTEIADRSKRPNRNIIWLSSPPPAHCEHQLEIVVYADPSTPKRCVKCGNREAK